MKKILLATVAVIGLAACSQNEEFDAPNQKEVIGFNTIVGKSIRAAEATTATLQVSGFQLYTYNSGTTEMENVEKAGLVTALINEKASYNTTSQVWELTNTYYWPLNNNLQFFGYSPTTNVKSWATTEKYPSFNYTIQDQQEDLLTAAIYDKIKTSNENIGNVSLGFNHILTQINFAVKGKDVGFKYTVTSIALNNVKNEGTYTFNNAKGAWTAQTGNTNYTYSATYGEIINAGQSTITGDNRALMLMPNDNITSVEIVVTYKCTNTNKTETYFDGTKKVTFDSSASWGIGKKILYTLVLPSGAEAIKVSGNTEPWSEQDEPTGSEVE